MAGHSTPLMTRRDAKVSKTALALERSPFKGTNTTTENNKGSHSGGLEDIRSGEIYIYMYVLEKQILNETSIPKSQGL